MLIISQHARLLHIPFPEFAVYRVNVAWVRSNEELYDLLKELNNDVFLDFPEGRNKPPKPVLSIEDLVAAMHKFDNIKYFGVTNVKNAKMIKNLREKVPKRIKLIPKIESKEGVDNLEEIFAELRKDESHIMLDKEDLYTDLNNHNGLFDQYVRLCREKCNNMGIRVLELQGVIFADD
ncbi:MAG: pyruvate kinase [Candidatus Saganbacteria bacterium]|nr:pyruvate kinase [Candidatus Saganbacteria bacterium]